MELYMYSPIRLRNLATGTRIYVIILWLMLRGMFIDHPTNSEEINQQNF
jgi:hypothetical protein